MLDKKYDHNLVEQDRYDKWLEQDLFKAGKDKDKTPFCIVIPPPNVTGKLHLGHAMNDSLQDIIIRYKKMNGYDALWVPGTDHAGIATQAKVDEKLKNEGINPRDMKRSDWLKVAFDWKEEYALNIRKQWAKLGLALDYSREAFTMNENLSQAVNKVFIDLYEKGIIYRGERIVNWDPQADTALSNVEVIYKDIEGAFYHIKYFIENTSEFLDVATTRPETMFGDTAVAVNKDDKRYKHLIGKTVLVPIINRKIPIIADDHADMNFGTGVVKITPAHDPNDFLVGQRHNLDRILCMNSKGILNEESGPYSGMDRFEARNQLLKDLEAKDLLIKKEKMIHAVGHSERTGVIVEPILSKQWFIKMDGLAKDLLNNQKDKDTKMNFIPKKYEKTLINWMENIQDWCISRQLWWGHQIPAWYKDDEVVVSLTCPGEGFIQDQDVLDTWFSSALWPFSTLGWPNNTDDFNRYYPNSILVTAYDIIFFWVARMYFQGLYFTKEKPFSTCLIHGLIRDKNGVKMSKSLGNGIDPMDVIDNYGADSLRLFLTTNSSLGTDLRYDEEKVKASWNFINKLWNASRFVIMNLEGFDETKYNFSNLSGYDKWILTKYNELIKNVTNYMDKYDINSAGNEIINFTWNKFCDWYIEFSKVSIESISTKTTLHYVLSGILKLLHPYIPFVTEKIYLTIKPNSSFLINEEYPKFNKELYYKDIIDNIDTLQEIIKELRNVKANNKDIGNYYIVIDKSNKKLNELFTTHKDIFLKIFKLEEKQIILKEKLDPTLSIISLHFAIGTIDVAFTKQINEVTLEDLQKEIDKLTSSIKRRNGLLLNQKYIENAPQEIIEKEKEMLEKESKKLEELQKQLEV